MIGPNSSGRSGREHHHRPAGLAIADHARLAVGLGVQRDHLFEEDRLGARDVLDGLARHRFGQEADEIAGMAGLERDADLAVGLEAADARAMAGARIDDDERPAGRIDFDAFRRNDPDERVVDRPLERAAVDDEFHRVFEHVRRDFARVARGTRCRAGASRPRNSTLRCAASTRYSNADAAGLAAGALTLPGGLLRLAVMGWPLALSAQRSPDRQLLL